MKFNEAGPATGVATLALALVASLGLAGAANAAPGDERLMPTETTGSLTINKYEGDPTGASNSGLALPDGTVDLPGLNDAGFTVNRVSCLDGEGQQALDLTTNAGWVNTAELFDRVGSNPTAAALGSVTSLGGETVACTLTQFGDEQKTTGGTEITPGTTKFADMPLGLYYVTETTVPEGFKSVLPFLVTVPMTNPSDTGAWLYDINVYPKDRPTATKTVADEDVTTTQVGDRVQWTITAGAPTNAGGSEGYYMVDNLDPKLAFSSSIGVSLAGPDGTVSQDLTRGDDYEIYLYEVPADGDVPAFQRVYMELTAAGLAKLDAAVATTPGLYVRWVFETEVLATGTIENDATIFENSPNSGNTGSPCEEGDEPCEPSTEEPPTPEVCVPGDPTCETTPPAITKFGGVQVTKTAKDKDSAGADVYLAGAEFQVYASHNQADACNPASAMDTEVTGTTGPDGKIVLEHFRASDWANGKQLVITQEGTDDPVVPAEWLYYCLVETKAPTGYELLPEGIPFEIITGSANVAFGKTVNTEDVTVAGEGTEPSMTYSLVVSETVVNVPSKGGFQLPLTGGIGTAIFAILGAGMIGGVFYYARQQGKKESAR